MGWHIYLAQLFLSGAAGQAPEAVWLQEQGAEALRRAHQPKHKPAAAAALQVHLGLAQS